MSIKMLAIRLALAAACAVATSSVASAQEQIPPATNILSHTIYRDIPATIPVRVSVNGPFTVGDPVGFRYRFAHGGMQFDEPIMYTVKAGDGQTQVLNGILAALIGNTNIANAWTQEGCSLNLVTAAVLPNLASGPAQMFFDQCWPMVTTAAFVSSVGGAGTETVTVTSGGNTAEAFPGLACGKSIPGRGAVPSDLFCGMYFYGPDSSGGPYGFIYGVGSDGKQQTGFPYIQIIPRILNSTFGQWDADITFIFGANRTVQLGAGRVLVDGTPLGGSGGAPGPQGIPGPAGPIGPPGGNVTGSIIESPCHIIATNPNNSPARNFVARCAYAFDGLGITGWRTVATLTPSNVAGSHAHGHADCHLSGWTSGIGGGSRFSRWAWQIDGASPAVGLSQDSPMGNPAQIRFVGGAANALLVQVQSSDGAHTLSAGVMECAYYQPNADGTPITWTLN